MSTSSTTELLYVPDWPERAEARLLRPWDRPRIRAYMRALGAGAQLLEDQAFDILESTTLENATGHALDQWGDLVGEQRGPLSDNDYRPFILARMLVNRSAGTIDELIEILDICTAPNLYVWHEDNLPAGLYLVVVRNSFMTEARRRRVSRLMEAARPGARHMTVIEAVPDAFGFDDTPYSTVFHSGLSRLVLPFP